ncbi:hypothetical protein BCY86_02685 [Pajaroellobacter abortibovis]|uniref:Uncharacterized protein n=1 Tax=Pajaroellobacter abortibovis TaxID=1882918 RepID=A0A1L6MVX5_9BACT|nr:hypothetical protein BCY86_02685 [Pajaroellobacter abortibovis]
MYKFFLFSIKWEGLKVFTGDSISISRPLDILSEFLHFHHLEELNLNTDFDIRDWTKLPGFLTLKKLRVNARTIVAPLQPSYSNSLEELELSTQGLSTDIN